MRSARGRRADKQSVCKKGGEWRAMISVNKHTHAGAPRSAHRTPPPARCHLLVFAVSAAKRKGETVKVCAALRKKRRKQRSARRQAIARRRILRGAPPMKKALQAHCRYRFTRYPDCRAAWLNRCKGPERGKKRREGGRVEKRTWEGGVDLPSPPAHNARRAAACTKHFCIVQRWKARAWL